MGNQTGRALQEPGTATIDTVIVAQPADIPTQLRRRRKASYRQPPLADGRRDPLDKPRRNRTVEWRAIGKNTVEFRGADGAVYLAIHTLGVRFMRAPRGGAWYVHDASADDVAALLETRGYDLRAVL